MHTGNMELRHDWTRDEIAALFDLPFNDLIFAAQTAHRQYFDPNEVQMSTLLSIKTGGCPEDCGYCAQSAKFETPVKAEKLMSVDAVLAEARRPPCNSGWRQHRGRVWLRPARPRRTLVFPP